MRSSAVELAQVLASVAHDLRSPLNAITGFSRLLLNGIDGPLSEMQAADLQAIHTSGDEMLRMVDCLIDLAKAQSGQLAPSPSAVHLDALLEKVVALHTGTGARPAPRIIYPATDLPQPLWVDGAILQKGLDRLLAALIRLVGEGRIEVDAQVEGSAASVRLDAVGAGALSPQASRALQAYRARGGSAEHRLDATALCMITAQQLLALQGATVQVETPLPEEIRVWVSLPLGASRTGPKLDP
jgi:K+-sensing histidine kinase KdpD